MRTMMDVEFRRCSSAIEGGRSIAGQAVRASLADIQSRVRCAVVTGDGSDIVHLLVGGHEPVRRLAIHWRHYHTSLVATLLRKFPATVWLIGTQSVTDAANAFVREYPPQAPCLAEYGADFVEFLSNRISTARVPYLLAFAELDWCLGQVSVAIDHPPLSLERFSEQDAGVLIETRLTLQPGLRYLQAAWPIDDLMKLYLTDSAPDQWLLEADDVCLEVRGARGEFRINRLETGDYVFRRAIQEGRTIGDAAESALDAEAGFDPGTALTKLMNEGLVTAIAVRGT